MPTSRTCVSTSRACATSHRKRSVRWPSWPEAAAKAAEPIYWNYGAFIQQCVDFAILAFCVFLMVKLMNRLMKKHAATPPAPPAPSKEELLLTEIRDLLRERQADGR